MKNSRKQLFLLPFAGANRNSYKPLIPYLEKSFDCIIIELPGRGARFNEALVFTIDEMVDDCTKEIFRQRNGSEWAIFGHSLGAFLTLFICNQKQFRNDKPSWIVASGRAAPNSNIPLKQRHLMATEALIQELDDLGGLPSQILNNKEMIGLIEPIVRADLRAIETYKYKETPVLDVPILVLGGSTDSINKNELYRWNTLTSQECEINEIDGGHFFILENPFEVALHINHFNEKIK